MTQLITIGKIRQYEKDELLTDSTNAGKLISAETRKTRQVKATLRVRAICFFSLWLTCGGQPLYIEQAKATSLRSHPLY